MAQYAYFASQHATAASWTAKLASANARAASNGRSASPYSNTFRLVCSFQRCQARRPPAPHSQNQAWPVIAVVRCIALSSASSAFLSAESCANGAAGRRASPEAMSQVLQLPARGRMGLVPVQEPGVTGTEPVHFVSKRSAFPRSTALPPIARRSGITAPFCTALLVGCWRQNAGGGFPCASQHRFSYDRSWIVPRPLTVRPAVPSSEGHRHSSTATTRLL